MKGYKQSEEHIKKRIEKTRLKLLGKKQSEESKLKKSISLKKAYQEGRRKIIPNIGKWNKGKKHSEEWIKKTTHLGQVAWNKGLTINKEKYKHHCSNVKGKIYLTSHVVWCQANQIHRIPDRCLIHHIDFNPQNNDIENLQLMPINYHASMHQEIQKMMRANLV